MALITIVTTVITQFLDLVQDSGQEQIHLRESPISPGPLPSASPGLFELKGLEALEVRTRVLGLT
jgi:hypothetical protein